MVGQRLEASRLARVMELLRAGLGWAGLGPMDVARATGVSKTYIYDLHNSLGGMYRPPQTSFSARFLDRAERYEIARLRESGTSVRSIAAAVGRAPSTVSRELRRNLAPRTGRYEPERADTLAWARQRRPKATVWTRRPALRAKVQQMLEQRLSPERSPGACEWNSLTMG